MSSYYSDHSSSEGGYESDDDLIYTIDLNNTTFNQAVHTARTATSDFRTRLNYQQEYRDIVACTIYRGADDINLRVITSSDSQNSNEKDSSTRERWVHVTTESISFEDFKRLAINVAFKHHDELVPVILYLLQKVQDNHEATSAYGSFIQPGVILRCDGTNQESRHMPDLSAIFASFPYFDVGKWKPPEAPTDESLHIPRGLFQSSYTQEIAVDRDENQIFRKLRGIASNKFLRVPQIWALVLQSKTIVTCGPLPLSDMFGENIEFVKEETLLAQGPSLVHITDLERLQRCIEQACLQDSDTSLKDCILHSGNNEEELDGSHWPAILKEERSIFVYVRISRKEIQTPGPDEKAIEALDESRLIEYASLSSDESGDEGDRMALMVINNRLKKGIIECDRRIPTFECRITGELQESPGSGAERNASPIKDSIHWRGLRPFQPTVESDSEGYESEDGNVPVALPEDVPAAPPLRTTEDNVESAEGEGVNPQGSVSPIREVGREDENQSATPQDLERPQNTKEPDLKQAIREEVTAALKRNEDEVAGEVDKRIDEEMRKRLARFGFQENQIQAMLNPELTENIQKQRVLNPADPMRKNQQPTYVKVHKEHLSIDTLLYYDIPYEIDRVDPNYIIVLREMESREMEILFEHTRRLRSRATTKLLIEERQDRGKSDYAWVRRSRPRRSPSRRHMSSPNRVGIREMFSGESEQKSATRRSRTVSERVLERSEKAAADLNKGRDPSPPPGTKQLQVNLKIPPFLAWPTTVSKETDNTFGNESHIKHAPRHEHEEDVTQITLSVISKHLSNIRKKDTELPVSRHHPFLASYRSGKAFVEVPELAFNGLESDAEDAVALSANQKPDDTLLDIHEELTFFQRLRLGTATESKGVATQIAPNSGVQSDNEVHRRQELNNNFSLIYVVTELPHKDYMQLHQLDEFKIPIEACAMCSKGSLYPDIDDAYKHLHAFHCQEAGSPTDEQRRKLGHWLLSTAGVELERRNMEMIKLIQALHHRTAKLLEKAIKIRNGVVNDENEKDEKFLLPLALVKAAQKIFQFIYTALYTVRYLREQNKNLTGPTSSSIEVLDNLALAEYYGIAADNELSKAQNELLLMAYTGSSDGTSVVQYIASTPETTVAFCMLCLIVRKLHQDKALPDLYRSHLSTLRYGATQNPSKRIFRELFLMEEELEVVVAIFKQQNDAMEALEKVLDSSSYRITNHVRVNTFKRLEQPAFSGLREGFSDIAKDLKKIQDQITKTAQVLRYNLEIAEEGQSKAILVFTLVTIIFLPLSFVASLFGMNTTDIRGIDKNQTIFWVVALPLTAIIGGLSLLVAYGKVGERLDALREILQEHKSWSRHRERSSKLPARSRDEEQADGMEPNPFPSNSTNRRKATRATFVSASSGKGLSMNKIYNGGRRRRHTMVADDQNDTASSITTEV
ncbi:hypothetical protein N0V90_000594 [Kalmusia sp. IMI 367209]|nr:hypothetical protein N0V90_000594 [Kalmusia sp. IMI 367209]